MKKSGKTADNTDFVHKSTVYALTRRRCKANEYPESSILPSKA